MTAQIHEGLAIGEYHKLERLSPSGIGALLRSPAHYQAQREEWATREPSKALRIGSAVHLLVLEPELVPTMLPVAPTVPKRSNADKATWAEWEASLAPGALRLTADERETAESAAAAVLTHEGIRRAELLKGRAEVSILWEQDGAPCKARPDLITERGFVVDLKTTEDAADFERSVAQYSYHRQAAWLQMAAAAADIECKGVVFIAVEKTAPYGIRTVILDSIALVQGEREIERALAAYRACTASGEWPNYPTTLDTLTLPMWRLDIED